MTGTVVIAGGGGLIGRALATDLAGAGVEVVILSRAAGAAPPAPGVRFARW
ncbi:MAG: NAD-dependent epimerase/dehydratase family protein, partial [Thermoanaerobaculia bacterium]